MIVTISFEITEKNAGPNSYVVDSLKNKNILSDLSDRATREFKRDLARMFHFAPVELDTTLLDAHMVEK